MPLASGVSLWEFAASVVEAPHVQIVTFELPPKSTTPRLVLPKSKCRAQSINAPILSCSTLRLLLPLARKLSAGFLRHHTSKGSLDLLPVSFAASLLAMKASKVVTTASIWAPEGLLESRLSQVAAVKFLSRVLDKTDTDALCCLAIIKINQNQCVGL